MLIELEFLNEGAKHADTPSHFDGLVIGLCNPDIRHADLQHIKLDLGRHFNPLEKLCKQQATLLVDLFVSSGEHDLPQSLYTDESMSVHSELL